MLALFGLGAPSRTFVAHAGPFGGGDGMGDAGPSGAPGMDEEDEEEDIDETGALQIESANPGAPRRRSLLGRLLPARGSKYGQVRSSTRGSAEGGRGGARGALQNCLGRLVPGLAGAGFGGGEADEEPLLFALTWAQPQRYGIAPSPRNGHTMVLIGMQLYIFGGGDENVSFNDVNTLHVGTMTWDKPVVHGTLPSPRARHSATAVGNNMVVFGGVGGGNDLHILETDTLTWYVPKVSGEPPLPRFGHSATLVESSSDQSRKIYLFGGHDGRRSLSDLHLFDTESMAWNKAAVSGRAPLAGSRHTASLVGEKLYVFGATDSGTFRDMHVLDIDALTWTQVSAEGKAPISRSRHTATLVGRNLLVFGGVGGGRPLNDLFVLHTAGGSTHGQFWTEPPANGVPPTQRVGHASAMVDTKVFFFGGHDGKACLNDVHVLVTMNWRVLNAKGGRPNPRVGCTLNTVGSKLVLLGGAAQDKAMNDVRVFELETGMWTVPTVSGTPPAALVGHSATLVGTELFVFGGSDGKNDGNDVHIFDTETHAWALPSLEGRAPQARVGHSGTAVSATKIYYYGGYGIRYGYSSDTHILDTALLSWSRPYINGAAPQPRVGHSAAVLSGKVYVYGGAANEKLYRDLHVLDTSTMSWIEPPAGGIAPGPLFGHSAETVGKCIFLFGGSREVVRHGTYASLHGRTYASNR